jgi:hypothetical protein
MFAARQSVTRRLAIMPIAKSLFATSFETTSLRKPVAFAPENLARNSFVCTSLQSHELLSPSFTHRYKKHRGEGVAAMREPANYPEISFSFIYCMFNNLRTLFLQRRRPNHPIFNRLRALSVATTGGSAVVSFARLLHSSKIASSARPNRLTALSAPPKMNLAAGLSDFEALLLKTQN